ncbi:MAG: protein kinase [Micromonosporaceae bacterium]|nr:protein kinase [Micromonosporaceae bacterium]
MTDPSTSSSHTTSQQAGPGLVVAGRYGLRAAVGTGGMGTVWRASDSQLGRDVAVKEVVPPPGIAPDDRDAMYERMLREARAAAVLSHPSIVQVYDVVTDGGRPWVVMELLDARSLSDLVLSDGPLAPRAVAKIGVALLGALEVAHAAGVLHRDVKPANVLVCTDGRCVLTDFGVARMPSDQQLTTPGMVLGSPHFISPERAMGASFGPPSDLFSLGVTLYLAVEGQPPFDRGEPIATMHSVVEDPPRPVERAGPLTDVLYGLLEKDPDRRWDASTARTVLRDLLAGPLASRTPMFPTDPYAVVPAQPSPWQPGGTPKVGGRALLDPSETPADRTGPAGPDDRADHGDPYGRLPDPYRSLPDSYRAPDAGTAPTSALPTLPPPSPNGAGPPRRTRHQAAPPGSAAAAREAGAQLLAAARRAPLPARIAAAGVAGVVLIALVWALAVRGGDDPADPSGAPPPGDQPSAGPPDGGPDFEVREYAGRGMVVNIPAQWQGLDNPALVYVDFVDPGDASAQLRLLAEPWSGDARGLVEFAETAIQDSQNCAEPYQRVGLTDIELAGLAGAQLEYTCGQGDAARHARWATVVSDGTAYSFRLTTPEAQFAERAPIFDELARSFHLAP